MGQHCRCERGRGSASKSLQGAHPLILVLAAIMTSHLSPTCCSTFFGGRCLVSRKRLSPTDTQHYLSHGNYTGTFSYDDSNTILLSLKTRKRPNIALQHKISGNVSTGRPHTSLWTYQPPQGMR